MEKLSKKLIFDKKYLPYYEACDDSDPCDAAGVGPFGVFIQIPSAAAQAHQKPTQKQQTEAKAYRSKAGEKYQRLDEKNGQRKKTKY